MSNTKIYPNEFSLLESEDTISLRIKVEKFLISKYGIFINFITMIFCFITFILYIISTYIGYFHIFFYKYDIIVLILLFIHYFWQLYSSQHKLEFFFKKSLFLEFIIILPIIFVYIDNNTLLVWYKFTIILRFIKFVIYFEKMIQKGRNDIFKQIIRIISIVCTLIIVISGFIYLFEYDNQELIIKKEKEQCIKLNSNLNNDVNLSYCNIKINLLAYHDMIYFVVVTLSTVGYGDIVPQTLFGRLFTILLIALALILIPKQTSELIRLMGLQSKFARIVYKDFNFKHIVICGNLSISSLKNFSNEFFHDDHGFIDKNLVILQQNIKTNEMLLFLQNFKYQNNMHYLYGNPLKEKDLKRANILDATTCVILTDKYLNDSLSIDIKNILTGLSIKKFVKNYGDNKNINLCMQLVNPESKKLFYNVIGKSKYNDQLIIIEEIKMNLLAKSYFCPGIITLLGNLITSSADKEKTNKNKEWFNEYIEGMGHEIYRVKLSPKLKRKKFNDLVSFSYEKFNLIMFGWEIIIDEKPIVLLNPGTYEIPGDHDIYVYLICENKDDTKKLANYKNNKNNNLKEGLIKIESEIAINTNSNEINVLKKSNVDYDSHEFEDINDDDEISLNESDFIEKEYIILTHEISKLNIIEYSIENMPQIKNHIIICGINENLYSFILPLRLRSLFDIPYIIILNNENLKDELWNKISKFPKIIYIKGSPLEKKDLKKAKIYDCSKIIILGKNFNQSILIRFEIWFWFNKYFYI